MVGQTNLLNRIDNLINTNSFPRTSLFEGDYGCGKHTLAEHISSKLDYQLIDITDSITLDTLEQIQLSPTPFVYLINADEISVKEQNMILKFLEEPLKNSYVILICESKQRLLETVINRCQCYRFESFSDEELSQFIDSDTSKYIVKFGRTPGWIKKLKESNIDDIVELCNKIFLKISVANYSNVLTISEKISLTKDCEDKIDFRVFVYLLMNIGYDLYLSNQISFDVFQKTSDFYNNSFILNINKRHLLEHYLVELKMLVEGE